MNEPRRPCRGAMGRTEAAGGRAPTKMLQETRRLGQGSRKRLCAHSPDLVALDGPPARLGIYPTTEAGDSVRRLPSRRAGDQLGLLLGARACRFERPPWGTREFLGARKFAWQPPC